MSTPTKIPQCQRHNLPQQIICTGQMCNRRIGCQLCIDKHDHKFYLDSKHNQKPLQQVQQQIQQKLAHLQKYTKSNITNLRLQNYRTKILQHFENEHLYIKNKIEEEMFNINLWIEKITKAVYQCLDDSKKQILSYWELYNATAQKYMNSLQDYQQLQSYFRDGDWFVSQFVEKSVTFLYSQEMFFKFNRNLDQLKLEISHFRKEDKKVMDWLQDRRSQFLKLEICPHKHFQSLLKNYSSKPTITGYSHQKTKESKDNRTSLLQLIKQDSKAILLYPQTIFEPFHNIYKLIRYDNQVFVTSGSRAINIWTRVSIQPEKSYPLNFPSYGVLSFVEYGKEEAEQIVYGKSNGEMGLIDVKKQKVVQMPAHQAAIRDILQLDSYHFLTASQDWKLKLWAMSTPKEMETKKQFATERLCLSGHSGRIYTICKFGPSVLAAGSDGTIKLWDIMRQSYDQTFQQQKQIYALAQLRPELFASGGQLKQLRIWDYRKTKSHICRYPIQNTCNTILRYDENSLIFNDKHMIKVVDIRNLKQPVERMSNDKTFTHVVNSMAYLSDNQIGMGGSDNVVSIWKY